MKPNPLENLNTIGAHIRKRRLNLQLFQNDVAKKLNVTTNTISYWENGKVLPTIQQYPKIISFLGYIPIKIDTATLSGKILYLRIVNGLSYKAIGKLIGIDGTTIASWEKNEHLPGKKKFEKLKALIDNSRKIDSLVSITLGT